MSEEKKAGTEVSKTEVSKVEAEGGRILFADEVVATIASLAVADVEGVSALSGGMVEGITEMLGKKNLTKGIKVEVGQEEAAVDVSVSVKYGYKIKEVCEKIQQAIKSANGGGTRPCRESELIAQIGAGRWAAVGLAELNELLRQSRAIRRLLADPHLAASSPL